MSTEIVLNYCNGCLKFNAGRRECRVLKKPFPLWTEKEKAGRECFSREENPHKLSQEVKDMMRYATSADSSHPNHHKYKNELDRLSKITSADVEGARTESMKTGYPWIQGGGGGGEKGESQFGKEAFKDNRLVHRKHDPKREDWNDRYGRKKR